MNGEIRQGASVNQCSNHWNILIKKFQSLELLLKKVPTIGTFSKKSSNHWKTGLAVSLCLFCAVSGAWANGFTTYYVDGVNGSDLNDGGSWATAKKTIQNAVDNIDGIPGRLVLVTNGVYDLGGAVTPGYTVTNRVMIDKPITVQSVNGPEVTFISGAPDTVGGSPSNGPAAIRGVFMGTNASLIGFTITNGYTRELANPSSYGGGIYSDQSSLISNCVVKDCHSYDQAGGINAMGHTLITDCRIENNEQDSILGTCAGGAYLANGVTMNSCIVSGNVANAASGSGGLYLNSDSYTQVVTVANSLIV
ncbi:MAG: hypothetical protein EOL87_15200, partial [Spartobacteria bacterium]|nr:hypothetical protein [Spartobacteria bacterium]